MILWRAFVLLLTVLLPALALADPSAGELTATQIGVNGENLSDTPVTDAIPMWGDVTAAKIMNQLSLTLTVTAGTTTTFTVKCAESESGAANTWAQITKCDSSAAAACAPDVRTYTIANYTTQNGTKVIASRWGVKKQYVQCTLDDAADGTGTVVITGTRSYQ